MDEVARLMNEMVEDFRQFVEGKEFTYKSALQVALEDLQETVTEEDQEELFAASLEELERLVEEEKVRDFDESRSYIEEAIKREIVSSIAGERGRYEYIRLRTDPWVLDAVKLLSAPQEYTKLMTPEVVGVN